MCALEAAHAHLHDVRTIKFLSNERLAPARQIAVAYMNSPVRGTEKAVLDYASIMHIGKSLDER